MEILSKSNFFGIFGFTMNLTLTLTSLSNSNWSFIVTSGLKAKSKFSSATILSTALPISAVQALLSASSPYCFLKTFSGTCPLRYPSIWTLACIFRNSSPMLFSISALSIVMLHSCVKLSIFFIIFCFVAIQITL